MSYMHPNSGQSGLNGEYLEGRKRSNSCGIAAPKEKFANVCRELFEAFTKMRLGAPFRVRVSALKA